MAVDPGRTFTMLIPSIVPAGIAVNVTNDGHTSPFMRTISVPVPPTQTPRVGTGNTVTSDGVIGNA